jgi:hypothetical protein
MDDVRIIIFKRKKRSRLLTVDSISEDQEVVDLFGSVAVLLTIDLRHLEDLTRVDLFQPRYCKLPEGEREQAVRVIFLLPNFHYCCLLF